MRGLVRGLVLAAALVAGLVVLGGPAWSSSSQVDEVLAVVRTAEALATHHHHALIENVDVLEAISATNRKNVGVTRAFATTGRRVEAFIVSGRVLCVNLTGTPIALARCPK